MSNHIVGLGIAQDAQLTRHPEHMSELEIAISDILHDNHFLTKSLGDTPLNVTLTKEGQHVIFCVQPAGVVDSEIHHIRLSTKPLRSLMRDYFLMVESYQAAIRSHDTRKIEAVDMGRRGMHNEGAEMITEMLEDKVTLDFNTARRIFTLVAILHMK